MWGKDKLSIDFYYHSEIIDNYKKRLPNRIKLYNWDF